MQEKIHRNVPRHVLVVIQKRSRTIKKVRDLYLLFLSYNFFSHPDYTVGFGISPNQLLSAAGKPLLPIESTQLEQMISTGVTVGAALAAWWNNNSFTPEAIEADAFMARMKKRVH